MATINGGDNIKAKLEALVQKIRSAKTVKVGFLEPATYPDGTSVPLIAAINEFGRPSKNQPPRPYFRRMINQHKGEWPKSITSLFKANDYDAKTTLDQAGNAIAGQLAQSIQELVEPPLAPSTIARKGFDKPLIDTSLLFNSVAHEVD